MSRAPAIERDLVQQRDYGLEEERGASSARDRRVGRPPLNVIVRRPVRDLDLVTHEDPLLAQLHDHVLLQPLGVGADQAVAHPRDHAR